MAHYVVHEWRMSLSELREMNFAEYFLLHATKAWAEGQANDQAPATATEQVINKPGDLARYIAQAGAPKIKK